MTVGKKIGAGFALVLLLQAVVGAIAYATTQRLIENSRWEAHTHQVIEEIARYLSAVKELETSQRGYVITGKEEYLGPYRVAQPEVEAHLRTLETLTTDNPEQQERLRQLRAPTQARVSVCQETIDARKKEGFEAALALVLTDRGRLASDEIRRVTSEMDDAERKLLAVRAADARASADRLTWVIVGGFGGALLASGLVVFLLVKALGDQVGGAVQRIQSSSAELQAAANQQASATREQVTSMAEINTTMRELLATSRQITDSAQRVVRIAEETASAARSGDQVVGRAQDSIASIKRQVDLVVTHMLELGRRSQQIGGVLELVNELLEQTNILAINATIEAASAGGEGRRFAAVADEIRKLSDRVGGSAKEVRALVDEIRASVNTTVMATESGSKAVDSGTRQFGEVAAQFKHIAGQVATTTDAAREIELSTKQQATAVEQVNVAIANVSQASRETEAGASQTLQTASELSSLSRELLRVVQAPS